MKKLGLIITVFLCSISCYNGAGLDLWTDDNSPSKNDTYFTPPSWIQGIWGDENYNENGIINFEAFKFSQNDFIVNYYRFSNDEGGVSLNERINLLSTKYLKATEQISSTNYKITILHLSINQDIYDFKYTSNTEITCTHESGTLENWSNRVVKNYTLFKQ